MRSSLIVFLLSTLAKFVAVLPAGSPTMGEAPRLLSYVSSSGKRRSARQRGASEVCDRPDAPRPPKLILCALPALFIASATPASADQISLTVPVALDLPSSCRTLRSDEAYIRAELFASHPSSRPCGASQFLTAKENRYPGMTSLIGAITDEPGPLRYRFDFSFAAPWQAASGLRALIHDIRKVNDTPEDRNALKDFQPLWLWVGLIHRESENRETLIDDGWSALPLCDVKGHVLYLSDISNDVAVAMRPSSLDPRFHFGHPRYLLHPNGDSLSVEIECFAANLPGTSVQVWVEGDARGFSGNGPPSKLASESLLIDKAVISRSLRLSASNIRRQLLGTSKRALQDQDIRYFTLQTRIVACGQEVRELGLKGLAFDDCRKSVDFAVFAR